MERGGYRGRGGGGRGRGGSRGGGGGRGDEGGSRGGRGGFHQDQRGSYQGQGGGGEGFGRGGYGGRGGGRGGYQQTGREQGYVAHEGSGYGGGDGAGRGVWSGGRGGRGRGREGQYQQQQQYHHPDQRVSGQGWLQRAPAQSVTRGGDDPNIGGSGSRGWEVRGTSAAAASQSQAAPERSATAPDPVMDPVIRGVQSVRISEQLPSTSSSSSPESKTVPVKRPDQGGQLAIRTVRLRVNHFRVNFNPQSIIRHYDIDVKPDGVRSNGRPVKISKADLSVIRNKLFQDNPTEFPLAMTAYDGEKNIFSAVNLPQGKFKVEFREGEDMRYRSYEFTIKLVNELKLCKLKDYLCRNLFSIPRDILQGMDVVMKENPSNRMIPVGRTFHFAEPDPQDDLGYGITASRGIQHSLKPTCQGLAVCLDYSVLAFRKRMPVLDFLTEYIDRFDIRNFGRFRRDVVHALENLKVTVTHRITKQKYTIVGLTQESTRNVCFPLENPDGGNAAPTRVSLVDYFQEKYGRNIRYLDIPCLDVSKNNRPNYLPMEFCVVAEGQIYPKDELDRDSAAFLKEISLAKPRERARRICGMVQSNDGPCSGEIIRNFGIEVDRNMTPVSGRVIGPPTLKLAGPTGREMRISVDNDKCQWNMNGKAVVEGRAIERWAVLDFTSYDRHRWNSDQFIGKLMAKCASLGMRMGNPLFYESTDMNKLSNNDVLRQLLESVSNRAQGRLQILICVMARKDEGYKYLKWFSETKLGMVTQCCLSTNIEPRPYRDTKVDQYLSNLALKINAKIGGNNVELIDRLPYFRGDSPVMFVGADVNHPAAHNKISPSIAAVVATVNWPAANRYAARVRPQEHRKEKILHFGEMCLELVGHYALINKVKPEKIVIFRDGVSESQFDMVLNEELVDLQNAFLARNYNPSITLIVAQKRHQTRFFPESERDGCSTGNVPPGTVVDTTIVHPFEFDFYLCSHYGSLGTSKPTHYHVLWDEHGISSDDLQKLIYNMCFTFSRCTKPVSLVPPVYYADLVAYRGRMYQEAMIRGRPPASASSSSSSMASSSFSSATSFDERFFKLHTDLENAMFFV